MKNIIYILSEYFAPFQNVGSVKFTKIAKYLSENQSNEVIVFSRKNNPLNDVLLEQDLSVMKKNRVRIYYVYEGMKYTRPPAGFAAKLHRWYVSMIAGAERYYYESNQRASRRFVSSGLNIIKKEKLPPPDLILSTYDDWGSHYLAREIKARHPEAVWIADFRDPVGAHIKAGKYRALCDEYSLMVSRTADFVTAVSQGIFDSLKLDAGTRTSVVTNGFDYSDYEYVKSNISSGNPGGRKLRFAYTGSFYGHSLMPFLNIIKELIEEGCISTENLEVAYAGGYNQRVFGEVTRTGLQTVYTYKGVLSRFDAVRLQHESDVLLTAVWNYKDYKGVIGGKFLSYLMLRKPIIGVVMGDTPGSELKRIMQVLNCGYCYEEANHDADYKMLKEAIFNLYRSKMSTGSVRMEYNEREVENFNLKNIASRYEEIFKSLRA